MNIVQKALAALAGIKQYDGGDIGGNTSRTWRGSRAEVRAATESSIADACFVLLVAGVTASRITLMRDGVEVAHPVIDWITPDVLAAIIRNGARSGNAICVLGLDDGLIPTGVYPIPSTRVTIRRHGGYVDGYITYRIRDVGNIGSNHYVADEVLHYRWQVDPDRPWLGLNPLRNTAPDAELDDRSARYASGFMRRFGIPGWVVSPKDGSSLPDRDRVQIREDTEENFGPDNSGGVAVLPVPMDMMQLQGPRQMIDIEGMRTSSEFRICAQLGIPPVLAGLSAGYRFTTANATIKEIRLQFAEGVLAPLMENIAKMLTMQLLPHIPGGGGMRFEFDHTDNWMFAKDFDAMVSQQAEMADILTVNERREYVGYDPLSDDDLAALQGGPDMSDMDFGELEAA